MIDWRSSLSRRIVLRQCVPKLEIGNATDQTIDRSVVLLCYVQAHLYKGNGSSRIWDVQSSQDSSGRKRHGLAKVLSIRPYPTCCTYRGAPITQSIRGINGQWEMPYLGECDVWNHDNVERGRSILLDAGITAGVVLVRARASVLLPRLAAVCLGNGSLRRSAGGRAG
jgi:hypothetical protein